MKKINKTLPDLAEKMANVLMKKAVSLVAIMKISGRGQREFSKPEVIFRKIIQVDPIGPWQLKFIRKLSELRGHFLTSDSLMAVALEILGNLSFLFLFISFYFILLVFLFFFQIFTALFISCPHSIFFSLQTDIISNLLSVCKRLA